MTGSDRRFPAARHLGSLGSPGLVGLLALAAALAFAACSPSVDPSSSPIETQPPSTPTAGPPTPTPTAPTSGVEIDPSLLEILPATVDGLAVDESPEGEAAALGDPLLDDVASALAAGLAIEPATGDFVYAVVVRLLPDAMDGQVFRDWRDSFDEGACSQADGVSGHAETQIGGRTVYIATCVGGLRTYHVWIEEDAVLISASAVGERRLGELLIENLRP